MSENRDPYNHGGMLAFIFSMVFVFVFFVYIVAIHPGVDLGENLQEPPSAEQLLADAAPVDISGNEEPWVANDDMVRHGKKVYAQNCAMCHGNEGRGDGAAGAGLNPRPRDLVEGGWTKGGGYIGLFKTVTNGIPGTSMAAYAHFKAADRWAVVQYIDSISKNKSKDDPAAVADFAKSAK